MVLKIEREREHGENEVWSLPLKISC